MMCTVYPWDISSQNASGLAIRTPACKKVGINVLINIKAIQIPFGHGFLAALSMNSFKSSATTCPIDASPRTVNSTK